VCGAAGRGEQGFGEQRQRREAEGHAWGDCYGNSPMAASPCRAFCSARVEEQPGQTCDLMELLMQPRPSRAVGSALWGSCVTVWLLELFSSSSSLGVNGQGRFVHLLAFFPLLTGTGLAAAVCRPVLFGGLSCRAGPARRKLVS